jgi:polar amino acid transport system substrate-binding protein
MRKALVAAAAAALALVAAGSGFGRTAALPALPGCDLASLQTVDNGQLTVGTDNPAYPPWFGGGSPKGSKWKINDPSTGKGYESAVTYQVARRLGFSPDLVQWTYVPFNKSYAPGRKPFDLDVNQISYTPQRARVVDFSSSYYDVNQSIVVRKGTRIGAVRSLAGLRRYKLAAQLGTTSYQFIVDRIRPAQKPSVFPQNAAAVQALKNGQIDGLVVDLPTAFYVTAVQVPNSKILGQAEARPGGEHFGFVLAKGNPLTTCVNRALAAMRADGTLKRLQRLWLAKATGAPILK